MPTFAAEIAWKVGSSDTFDDDRSPSTDAKGTGLVAGLAELWCRTLWEGIVDSGDASFTHFWFVCGPLPDGERLHVDAGVQPFANHAYAKLRGWVYGRPRSDRREPASGQPRELIGAVARAHARLIERGIEGPGWHEASAPGLIRACIAACTDPATLVARLDEL